MYWPRKLPSLALDCYCKNDSKVDEAQHSKSLDHLGVVRLQFPAQLDLDNVFDCNLMTFAEIMCARESDRFSVALIHLNLKIIID